MSSISVKELSHPAGEVIKIAAGKTLDLKSQGTTTLPTGSVLQVVNATKVDGFLTTSASFVDVGLTATITPTSTTSKILVQFTTITGNGTAGWTTWTRLMRGSTPLSVSTAGAGGRNGTTFTITGSSAGVAGTGFIHLDSPSTTSATTYKLQLASEGSSVGSLNRRGDGSASNSADGGSSSITLTEIQG